MYETVNGAGRVISARR